MGKDLSRLKPPQLTAVQIEPCFMWLRAFMLMQGNKQVIAAKKTIRRDEGGSVVEDLRQKPNAKVE